MESQVPMDSAQPAGFWLRVWAKLADLLVLNVIMALAMCGVSVLSVIGARLPWVGIAFFAPFALWAMYLAFFTGNGRQTLGYRLAGIRVTTSRGHEVGVGRALLRSVIDVLAYLLIFRLVGLLDYLAASVRSKRSLHDMASGTRVIQCAEPRCRALWVSGIASFVVPVALVFGLVRPFFLQPYFIPSAAMIPTLAHGDRVLVNKLSYRCAEPRYGDLVVYRCPPEVTVDRVERDFIKRVVGRPGDVLEVKEDGYLYRNGRRLYESYLLDPRIEYVMKPTVVPRGRLFVMGDNRNNSNDSHAWGPLDRSRLRGKVMATLPRSWFSARTPEQQ